MGLKMQMQREWERSAETSPISVDEIAEEMKRRCDHWLNSWRKTSDRKSRLAEYCLKQADDYGTAYGVLCDIHKELYKEHQAQQSE